MPFTVGPMRRRNGAFDGGNAKEGLTSAKLGRREREGGGFTSQRDEEPDASTYLNPRRCAKP
jgi:hypothetical protein